MRLLLVFGLIWGCGQGGADAPVAPPQATASPPDAAHIQQAASFQQKGYNLYSRKCAECHEFNGSGIVGVPPLAPAMSKEDGDLLAPLRGERGHRPFSEPGGYNYLTPEEQREILLYMRAAFTGRE